VAADVPRADAFGAQPWGLFNWGNALTLEEAQTFGVDALWVSVSPVYGRYLRIEIDDAANPAGYVRIGRLMVANGFMALRSVERDFAVLRTGGSEVVRPSRTGVPHVTPGASWTELDFALRHQAGMGSFAAMDSIGLAAAAGRHVWASVDVASPLVHRLSAYGVLEPSPVSPTSVAPFFGKRFSVKGVPRWHGQ